MVVYVCMGYWGGLAAPRVSREEKNRDKPSKRYLTVLSPLQDLVSIDPVQYPRCVGIWNLGDIWVVKKVVTCAIVKKEVFGMIFTAQCWQCLLA